MPSSPRPRAAPATPPPIPILGTVTPGRERYCPILAAHLDRVWPGHPPVYYALPAGRSSDYDGVVATDATSWTGTLLRGLEHLEARLGATHVFVLLEDHVPLWPCDAERVAEVMRIAVEEGLDHVAFVKYEWPWRRTGEARDADGRALVWREIDVVTLRGRHFARVPRDYAHYNQCQPALWRLRYYRDLLDAALERGIVDPWTFERLVLPGQPQHYVADDRWPSRPAGYRRRGRIDLRALYVMKMPEGKPLRQELLRERFPRLPPFALAALGRCLGTWGRLRRLPRP